MTADAGSGVLLMTYGSPATLEREDIASYLARVRGGRDPSAELVDEFVRRYRVIGGSPLIAATRAQAAALAYALGWPVEVGMRFSEPSIEAGLRALARRGVANVAAIILSPQYSPLLMGGYAMPSGMHAADRSTPRRSSRSPGVAPGAGVRGGPRWSDHRGPTDCRQPMTSMRRTLLTAHSMPRHVADANPGTSRSSGRPPRSVAARPG